VPQQPAFPVFCFERQKVPYPASSFIPDIKLSWRTSHYYQINVVELEAEMSTAPRFWKILPRTSRAAWLLEVLSRASAAWMFI